MQTTKRIRIKAEKDDEKRRISILAHELNFASLCTHLAQLFEIDTERQTISIKYVDIEDDWITISSDQELEEALSLEPEPLLRLTVSTADIQKEQVVPEEEHQQPVPQNNIPIPRCRGSICKPSMLFLVPIILLLLTKFGFWCGIALLLGSFYYFFVRCNTRRQFDELNQLRQWAANFMRNSADWLSEHITPRAPPRPTKAPFDNSDSFPDIPESHREQFQVNLTQLEEMGWKDRDVNRQMMLRANGDVERAIEYLIESQ